MSKGAYAGIEPVAKYFGVSSSTIRLWVRQGKIPERSYIKIGNTYRFHIRAVEDALLNYKSRAGMSDEERNEFADNIIKQLEVEVVETSSPRVSKERLDEADAELGDKAKGVPHVKGDPEIDAALGSILDEPDELKDL